MLLIFIIISLFFSDNKDNISKNTINASLHVSISNNDTPEVIAIWKFVSRDSFVRLNADSIKNFIENGMYRPTILTNCCFDYVTPLISLVIPRGSLRYETIQKINSIDTLKLLLVNKSSYCNDTCPSVKNKILYMSEKDKTIVDLIQERIIEIQEVQEK